MRTKRELVSAALQELRILGAGESPSAEDFALVSDHYEDLRAELVDKGLTYWTNTSSETAEIPNVIFRPLSRVLASRVADAFGKQQPTTTDDNGEPASSLAVGMRDLRRHIAQRPSGEQTWSSSY